MKYYKVKNEYDQHSVNGCRFLVKNELYTEKEKSRLGIPDKCVDEVNVSRWNVYWNFGARFSMY